jgi:hypothetical protein
MRSQYCMVCCDPFSCPVSTMSIMNVCSTTFYAVKVRTARK